MKNKLSIFIVTALMIFAFVPALTLAQDDVEDNQDIIIIETEKTYENLEELLADLEVNEDLTSVEYEILKLKLIDYDESLNIDSISAIVDKILAGEIDLGQGFVILRNLDESVNNGFEEEKALELINNYQNQENSGQFAFQVILELRKLSREDFSGEKSVNFLDEIASIIEENGDIENSELKQLAAEYRKEAREENRERMKAERTKKSNSASENALEKDKSNNASENALNKDNKGKENSNNSKTEEQGEDKSPNSNANQNANK